MKNKKLISGAGEFMFLVPALIIFTIVVIIPFFNGIGISLTNWDGLSPNSDFVGLRNFQILFQDTELINPIKNTLLFTVITVVFVNVIGLALALGVSSKFKGSDFIKSILFMPLVISLVLSAFIWSFTFSNVFPKMFGIPGLLGNTDTVMYGLSIICIWRDCGLAMMTYFATIQSIPEELYEASRVDGANVFQRFKNVTLPNLAPAFTINITLWLGWGLKVFDYPMAATGGGPGKASETLAMYVYNYAFPYNKAGYGQAAALVMMIGIFIISSTVTTILRKRELDA